MTFTLGSVLTVYASAGILFETFYAASAEAERVLCRFFLCHNAPLVWGARQQLTTQREEDLEKAIGTFRTVLQRNAHDPHRWAELGEAFLEAGRKEEARYCYGRVLALAPQVPSFLLRGANFHFQIGENKEALQITARILKLIPDYDSVIFSEYTRLAEIADVLRYGVPEEPRAGRSWLRELIRTGRAGDARLTWDWVATRGLADDAVAGEYVAFLIRQGDPESAAAEWARHVGRRASEYRKSNYLYNGDFEAEPAGSPFDWSVARTPGVEITRDLTTAWSGNCSLRISFAGTENLGFAAASQLAVVRPGHYHFRAFVRTDGVTTDEGIRFRISDAEAPARLDVILGQFTGSRPWSEVQIDLVVPRQTKLLRVEVIRQPSMKFDNRIGGTAWIDAIKLAPAG